MKPSVKYARKIYQVLHGVNMELGETEPNLEKVHLQLADVMDILEEMDPELPDWVESNF